MPDRGTVIKSCGKRAFVMNERCEFVEITTGAVSQAGDRVEYSPADVFRPGTRPVKGLALAVSLIVACLLVVGAFQSMLKGKAYAYIVLDVNPSIEIGIDESRRVISITGYNDEDKRMTGGRDLLKSPVDDVLGIIIKECLANNYLILERRNDIAVSVYMPGETGGLDLMRQLHGALGTQLAASGVKARTYFFSIDNNTWREAKRNKVSPARHLLLEQAEKRGYSVPLREISLRDPRINSLAREIEEKISWTLPLDVSGEGYDLPQGLHQPPADKTESRAGKNGPGKKAGETVEGEKSGVEEKDRQNGVSGGQNQDNSLKPEGGHPDIKNMEDKNQVAGDKGVKGGEAKQKETPAAEPGAGTGKAVEGAADGASGDSAGRGGNSGGGPAKGNSGGGSAKGNSGGGSPPGGGRGGP